MSLIHTMSAEVFQTDLFATGNTWNLCIQSSGAEKVIASVAKQSPLVEQSRRSRDHLSRNDGQDETVSKLADVPDTQHNALVGAGFMPAHLELIRPKGGYETRAYQRSL